MGLDKAAEIQMASPSEAGVFQLCVVEISFTSSVLQHSFHSSELLIAPKDASRKLDLFNTLYSFKKSNAYTCSKNLPEVHLLSLLALSKEMD